MVQHLPMRSDTQVEIVHPISGSEMMSSFTVTLISAGLLIVKLYYGYFNHTFWYLH